MLKFLLPIFMGLSFSLPLSANDDDLLCILTGGVFRGSSHSEVKELHKNRNYLQNYTKLISEKCTLLDHAVSLR